MRIRLAFATFGMLLLAGTAALDASSQSTHQLMIRGHIQQLHLYGPADGTPVVVASGDGGWIHLGPHVAELLASRGFFVVGFDVKAYLAAFTTETATLRAADEPGDFKVLAAFASAATGRKPILVGVSEGAGLSVLAAADPETKAVLGGVVGLGLPDRNELGWRWKDSLIYLTHKPPNEPAFSATTVVRGLAPLPVRCSSQRTMSSCRSPKRNGFSCRRQNPSASGSSTRSTIASAITCRSSTPD
jgi:type IV secretory pathway VirJ component